MYYSANFQNQSISHKDPVRNYIFKLTTETLEQRVKYVQS